MRAKDMATQYLSEVQAAGSTIEARTAALKKIFKNIAVETGEIIKARKCQCKDAISAVFREQDQKWQAFVRQIPADHGVNPHAFLDCLMKLHPELSALLEQLR